MLVFSRLVEPSPTATGTAHPRNAPDDVFAKDALCSELLAGAGVDIPVGQHVLLLVTVPGRGGLMDPTATASADADDICCANSEASTPTAATVAGACCAPAAPTQALRGNAGGETPRTPNSLGTAPRSARHRATSRWLITARAHPQPSRRRRPRRPRATETLCQLPRRGSGVLMTTVRRPAATRAPPPHSPTSVGWQSGSGAAHVVAAAVGDRASHPALQPTHGALRTRTRSEKSLCKRRKRKAVCILEAHRRPAPPLCSPLLPK